ncbi:MAG: deoxyribose-phosphate aldolase [Chloroflexi bacterium RBG_19FT_COMBO_49_13]|nr:MAG: deoxyribose-phosphate aldolase [Chloroflexi bacterium RBG_19FT_COMBO_49_13]
MRLTPSDIAQMIDLSCVRTTSNKADIDEMVDAASKYGFGQVSVLQCFIPYTRQLLKGSPNIHLVGNVSFPSGSDSTSLKIVQAKEMVVSGCDEIDMVMNIGKLRSGELAEVEADVGAVIETVHPIPVKVIIEIMYLTMEETSQACDICLRTGAAFIKTGTGWANRGTTLEDVRLVKSLVGDRIKIKASGGIRELKTLVDMYNAGARRFGVNLKSGIKIVEECLISGSNLEV